MTTSPSKTSEWVEVPAPDISHIATEDETPVDNLFSEKQQRFLVHSIYTSLSREVPFLATANVGLFYALHQPPLVPDIMVSFDVTAPADWREKQNRSYFVWVMGKPPEVAIEIVSNTVENELGSKLDDYARAGVAYYAVFDPFQYLSETVLQVYRRDGTCYQPLDSFWMEQIDLGLTLWEGTFEGHSDTWLRWCDRDGNLLLTGDELANRERQRADSAQQRADRLAQLLRERGIDPDELNGE